MKQDEADQPAKADGARQRRFWSAEEKRRMVAESFAPARRCRRWRSATASMPRAASTMRYLGVVGTSWSVQKSFV